MEKDFYDKKGYFKAKEWFNFQLQRAIRLVKIGFRF